MAHRILRLARPKFVAGSVALAGAFEYQKASCKEGKPFSLTVPKYDESNFQGRFFKMLDVIDPSFLQYGDKDLAASRQLMKDFEAGTSTASDEELWHAKKMIDVMVHPVTGESMFWLGRMSAFVPLNVPICVGMLSANTPATQIFMQWVNQTYNVTNNYVNRSSDAVEWADLGKAYGLAVGASATLAVGLSKVVAMTPALQAFGLIIPYSCVVAAGSANVSFTRMDEIKNGVKITDPDDNVVGVSKAAGKQAVQQTVLTRCVGLPVLPLVLPPLTLKMLGVTSTFGKMLGETILVAAAFSVGLPAALAILPQKMEVDVSSLEPEFQDLKDKNGSRITKFYANKGL